MNELIEFLVKAKKSTYASGSGYIEPSRKGSKDLRFIEGDYEYFDSYVGGLAFSGQEIVYEKGMPIWSMNYYGYVFDEARNDEIIVFLKEALVKIEKTAPYRGPQDYAKGTLRYVCISDGNISCFKGHEEIYYVDKLVYKLHFHGGHLK